MNHVLKNNHETFGVFSAFIIFLVLQSIGVSGFMAFPICMISGLGIALYLKN
tara:strand:+ start:526 stop:681 length:156 start_codon:yes stop_codon:yes gene_type:complete